MAILRAYALPHPPLAVPDVGRGEESKISDTLSAFDEVAAAIAELVPETIIYITPHNVLYSDYFHISPGISAKGDLSQFNARDVRFEAEYDTELVNEIARLAEQSGIHAGTRGEKNPRLDHGTTVPIWFINRRWPSYRAVRVSQSGMGSAEHYRLGQVIAEVVEKAGRRAVVVASGDLSHKLSESGPYGLAREGETYDNAVTDALSSGDFLSLLAIPESVREKASECGHNSLVMLAGCFDRKSVDARLISYEAPFGVGYAVAEFFPGEADEERNFLERFEEMSIEEARRRQDSEDCYRQLARQSLEHAVRTGTALPIPGNLPDEMLSEKAGVFVSLHKNGRLRGCVGTIFPTTDNVALEIIQNAVSAGLADNRFEPVNDSELPHLTYKVDILSRPEPIAGPEELDVRRYGVIVSAGHRRGLLLPNLDGVDTVDRQLAIARQKAGISDHEPVKLERFEVFRHE